MIALVWRQADPPIRTQWRGPDGSLAPSALSVPPMPLATLIGPPGLAGPAGAAGPAGPVGPSGPAGPTGPAGSAALSGSAQISIPAAAGAWEVSASVAALGVVPTNRLFLALAPASDADENDPELVDLLSLAGSPGTDSISVTASFAAPVSGPLNFNWSAF